MENKFLRAILLGCIISLPFFSVFGDTVKMASTGNSYTFDEKYGQISRVVKARSGQKVEIGNYFNFDWKILNQDIDKAAEEFRKTRISMPEKTVLLVSMTFNNQGTVERIRFTFGCTDISELSIEDIDLLDTLLRKIKIDVKTDYPDGAEFGILKRIKI